MMRATIKVLVDSMAAYDATTLTHRLHNPSSASVWGIFDKIREVAQGCFHQPINSTPSASPAHNISELLGPNLKLKRSYWNSLI